MNEMDISALINKAQELKALFVLGQRVIPFLEEIFIFVSEIKPLIDEINNSIEENLQKMPNASKQLSKVTEATENATTEIMDIVDGLVYKTDIISKNIKSMSDINSKQQRNPFEVLDILYKAIKDEKDLNEMIPELTESIEDYKKGSGKKFKELTDNTDELLQSIQMDSSSIMMSLQVQDITSQQIAAVNHLLETIQSKLSIILTKFNNTELSDIVNKSEENYAERTNVSKLHRSIAFDPEAVESITFKDKRQGEVDQVLSDHANGILTDDDDVDEDVKDVPEIDDVSITNNNEGTENQESAETENPEESEEAKETDFEQFSQDDIDALFG